MRQPRWAHARAAAAAGAGCALLLIGTAAPAPADGPFVDGSGDAVANLGRVVARASGLPLATTFGRALAHYQGTSARGESAALDFGILGVLLTSPSACGRAPLTPDQLPKRTIADSNAGPPSASRATAGQDPVAAGQETAAARPGALAEAAYTAAALDLGGVMASGEGRSSSAAELVAGKERRATAVVRLGNVDLAGGLVSLRGLHWTAEQRTGPGGLVLGAAGTFGTDTVVVGGVPLPTATALDLAAAFGSANKVIAPFGLRLEPPRVEKSAGDREVRVTPLKLVLGDGTAAKPVLGPLMEKQQPAREALLAAMKGFGRGGCDGSSAGGLFFTFVDVVAAALQGSGGIDLELGGVLATTEGVDYGDPFGLVEPGLPALPGGAAPIVRPGPARSPLTAEAPAEPLPATDSRLGGEPATTRLAAPLPSTGTAAPAGTAAAAEPVAILPVTRRCESTSRGRVSGCSRGAPLPASAAALSAALLLFGADWRRSRRRTLPEAQT